MFTPIENRLGIQPIAVANIPLPSGIQVGQSQYFGKAEPLGTIVRAYDPVYGEGEFIYLQSVTATIVGSLVTWAGFGTVTGDPASLNEAQYQAALLAATTLQGRPIAVAMSAFPSGSPATAFGWFQIGGTAVVSTNGTFAVNSPPKVFAAGSGQATSAPAASAQIVNAAAITANGTGGPAGNFALMQIMRPFMQGQIT
jgi:hypothetical protein